MTNNELKLIKENSRLKLGITTLIEEITGIKEYRNIRNFLIDIITNDDERKRIEKEKRENLLKSLGGEKKNEED